MTQPVAKPSAVRNQPPKLTLKIFFARSGDVLAEYLAAEVIVRELQRDKGFKDQVDLIPVSWNADGQAVPMNGGLDPQHAVTSQLGHPGDCDIVVTMFWSRQGCAYVDRHGVKHASGTGWEVLDALEKQHQHLHQLEREAGRKLTEHEVDCQVRPYLLAYHRQDSPQFPSGKEGRAAVNAWTANFNGMHDFLDEIKEPTADRPYALKALNPYTGLDGDQGFKVQLARHLRSIISGQLAAHRQQWQATEAAQIGHDDAENARAANPPTDPWPAYRDRLLAQTANLQRVGGSACPIERLYVPAMAKRITDDPAMPAKPLMDWLSEGSWVLEGGAGSGKTLFCRWLIRSLLLGHLPAQPSLAPVDDPDAVVQASMQALREGFNLQAGSAADQSLQAQFERNAAQALGEGWLGKFATTVASGLQRGGVDAQVCKQFENLAHANLTASEIRESLHDPLSALQPRRFTLRDWVPRGQGANDRQHSSRLALMHKLRDVEQGLGGADTSLRAALADLLAQSLQAGEAWAPEPAQTLMLGLRQPDCTRYLLVFDGLDELPADLSLPEFKGFNPRMAVMRVLNAARALWTADSHRLLITTRPENPDPRQVFGTAAVLQLQGLSTGWRTVYLRQYLLAECAPGGSNPGEPSSGSEAEAEPAAQQAEAAQQRASAINAGILAAVNQERASRRSEHDDPLAPSLVASVSNPLLLAAAVRLAPQDKALTVSGTWLQTQGQFSLMQTWVDDALGVRCAPNTEQTRCARDLLRGLAQVMHAVDNQDDQAPEPVFHLDFDQAVRQLLAQPRAQQGRAWSKAELERELTWLASESGLIEWQRHDGPQDLGFVHRSFQDYFVAQQVFESLDIVLAGSIEQAAAQLAARWQRSGGMRAWQGPLLQVVARCVHADDPDCLTAHEQRWLTVVARALLQSLGVWQQNLDAVTASQSLATQPKRRSVLAGPTQSADQLGQALMLAAKILRRVVPLLDAGDVPAFRQPWQALCAQVLPLHPAFALCKPVVRAAMWRACADLGWDDRVGLGLAAQPLAEGGTDLPLWHWCAMPTSDGKPLFWMAAAPVTVVQYDAFVLAPDGRGAPVWFDGLGKDASQQAAQPQGPSYWTTPTGPRETVSWYEAVACTRWLTARVRAGAELGLPQQALQAVRAGHCELRLPTEQEWHQMAFGAPLGEHAMRSYPWGDQTLDEVANTFEASLQSTTPVGLFVGTPAGAGGDPASTAWLWDLGGNVWEWCLNQYGEDDEPGGVAWDSERPRAVRGGAWDDNRGSARASDRFRRHPTRRNDNQGFRVVCAPPIAGR